MITVFHKTDFGEIHHTDSLDFFPTIPDNSVNMIVTSPPFSLLRKKEYGNVNAENYLEWFRPFASEFKRTLCEDGSLVIDIGGSWNKGLPTKNIYQFKLLIMLCEEMGFHLAQDFYWWNPSKLPSPIEWVNIRKIRVKDAVNTIWWLSKTPYPKASNKRVLQPYSESMRKLCSTGCKPQKRPSGHNLGESFSKDNGGSIPPNLLAVANTESNTKYLKYCKNNGIKPHPARFPSAIPEFFIRMLTDKNDFVVDPFAGSCVTGEVCEKLGRKWICCDTVKNYLYGALGRFAEKEDTCKNIGEKKKNTYSIQRPNFFWNNIAENEILTTGKK